MYSYLFTFGDLNFRVEESFNEARKQIILKQFGRLLKKDQLSALKEKNNFFNSFKEMLIRFAPTYKFDSKTHNYDSKKKR